METDGYIIIRDAIKYPALKIRRFTKDDRVHSKNMWKLRFEVKKHFQKLWNTKNLVSCFGGNVIDCEQFTCVQGILALSNSNATQLLAGSHRYFQSMSYRCTSKNPYEWEYYEIPDHDAIWKRGLKIVTPNLNPGDLLIFDSRIVHRVIDHDKRSVAYISMVPRAFLSNLTERLRRKAYKNNMSTSHWCEKIHVSEQDFPIQKNLETNDLV